MGTPTTSKLLKISSDLPFIHRSRYITFLKWYFVIQLQSIIVFQLHKKGLLGFTAIFWLLWFLFHGNWMKWFEPSCHTIWTFQFIFERNISLRTNFNCTRNFLYFQVELWKWGKDSQINGRNLFRLNYQNRLHWNRIDRIVWNESFSKNDIKFMDPVVIVQSGSNNFICNSMEPNCFLWKFIH